MEKYLDVVVSLINNRPRKCLDLKSPYEVFCCTWHYNLPRCSPPKNYQLWSKVAFWSRLCTTRYLTDVKYFVRSRCELTVIYSANSPQTCKGLKKLWNKVAFWSRLCRQVVFIPGISRNSWLKKEIMSIIQKSK